MTEDKTQVLDLIARGDHAELEAALGKGADADARDRWGVPALSLAAGRGDVAAVRLLLEHGAAVDKASDAGNSPLMAAAARGYLEVMTALLDGGADPGHRNKWGLGAADWAQWPANSAEVLALLHSRGG